MDVQEATAMGVFVCSADHLGRGNVGVRQLAKITERVCYACWIVSAHCDCYDVERSVIERKPYAESSVAILGTLASAILGV
jgi:hypothetical protein